MLVFKFGVLKPDSISLKETDIKVDYSKDGAFPKGDNMHFTRPHSWGVSSYVNIGKVA